MGRMQLYRGVEEPALRDRVARVTGSGDTS